MVYYGNKTYEEKKMMKTINTTNKGAEYFELLTNESEAMQKNNWAIIEILGFVDFEPVIADDEANLYKNFTVEYALEFDVEKYPDEQTWNKLIAHGLMQIVEIEE